MDSSNDNAHSPVTSLDLLMELQGEQNAFRFLIRALGALLATAAVVAVGSVLYFYFQLQGLRAEYARQAQLNQVNLRIVAGEASRQRESTQAQLVAIREENEAARREAELSRELQQAGSARQIAGYKDQAVAIARDHILGKPMNEVTSQVVSMVLRTDESGSVSLLTEPERILMQAALDDWGGQVESSVVRNSFQELLDEHGDLSDQAIGAAIWEGVSRVALELMGESVPDESGPSPSEDTVASLRETLGDESLHTGPFAGSGRGFRNRPLRTGSR